MRPQTLSSHRLGLKCQTLLDTDEGHWNLSHCQKHRWKQPYRRLMELQGLEAAVCQMWPVDVWEHSSVTT